jgi:outer membrane murein-binding lipoprotein Lpp
MKPAYVSARRTLKMQKMFVAAALISAALLAGSAAAAPAAYEDPLDARTLNTIRSRFSELIELANRHDLVAVRY